MFGQWNFDSFCGAFVATVRSAMRMAATAFNAFDPFQFVRATSQLQHRFVQLFAV